MIELDGHKLKIDDLVEISRYNEKTRLKDSAIQKMIESRKFVEKISSESRSIYGINTGFGPLCRTRISRKDFKKHQLNLLHHLSVGQGDLFSEEETRAIMTARANALARGYSGIRPLIVNRIIDFLNAGVIPEIPREGSVGASGDLVPLAHMSRSIINLGSATYQGKKKSLTDISCELNFEPLELLEKEGLALVNGTSVMTGLSALCTHDAGNLLSISELLSSFFVQIMYGEPEPFCHRVAFARGHRGQSFVSERIAEHLCANSYYQKKIKSHKWGTYSKPIETGIDIQDPYSLRCVPQILGAFQDALWHIESVVTQEINSTTDNPVIFPVEEMVIHCGNFYGQHISMTMDYLRIGMAKMALLTERQLERILNEKYNLGLPFMLSKGELGLNSGFMGCQLLATSLAAEIRMLTTPASIQTIPTNGNNQDVVSMGTHSSKATCQMIPLIWKIMAIQSMALAQAFEIRNDERVAGETFKKFHQAIREVSPFLHEDRPMFEEIPAVLTLIQSKDFISRFCHPRD